MFNIVWNKHEKRAREFLISSEIVPEKELSLMTRTDIEDKINEHFISFKDEHDDWLLVPKEKEKEFVQMVTWIS